MTKRPVGSKVIAFVTAALTMIVMCGLPTAAFAWNGEVNKEETVYVVTDSTGTQQDVIVSDHLVNKGGSKTISDETTLSDIENVKGEETFKQSGDSLTWDAEGNSIYYQGKTTEEVPVTMDVVYRLNDRVVSGPELQGQSGKVEIKINYENSAEYKGTTVPFIVMTGMVVTDDSFQNVHITKGKVIDDGDKLLIVGMAAPGLAQTLDIGESDLGIGSSITITGDADKFAVEDMMTIVTNAFFEDLDTDGVGDLDYDDEINALDKGAKQLVDGSDQLYEGLDTLSDKMPDLKKGVKKLKDGSKTLETGTNTAKDGAQALNDGIIKLGSSLEGALKEILGGVTKLETGSGTLHDGLKQVKTGVDTLNGGVTQLQQGMASAADSLTGETNSGIVFNEGAIRYIGGAESYINAVEENINALYEGNVIDQATHDQLIGALDESKKCLGDPNSTAPGSDNAVSLINYSNAVDSGVAASLTSKGTGSDPTLYDGTVQLAGGLTDVSNNLGSDMAEGTLINGAYQLNAGLTKLMNSITDNLKDDSELNKGMQQLTAGSSDLANGEIQLAGGAKQLADGMTALNDNTKTMVNGVYQLGTGANKLRKGMAKLYDEGIKKIVDMYNDDLKGTLDRVDGMLDAGKGYKTFTKLPSGMDGNVKFIYKTDMTD